MTQTRLREALGNGAVAFLFLAAFPRLAYRLRWPTRLGPGRLMAYIAFDTAFGFAVRQWVVPYFERMAEGHERGKEELRQHLGREPTADELLAHLGIPGKS